ncbi:hypothetical protein QAD02_001509 [Eretmocerus hayati]|uniref:Uncharacterized protein n=1 Tax=Eretmocerus hayati TaxID=131215 RepID=A0ACC2NGF4_9HYME|nr:hypothetical protein QAD02_001509 [Eretmocerus hayati]
MDQRMDRQRRAARIRVQNYRLKQKLLKAMNEVSPAKVALKTEKPCTQQFMQVEPSQLISIALNRAMDDNDVNKNLSGHEVYVTADALGSINGSTSADNFNVNSEFVINEITRVLEDSLQTVTLQLTQTIAETENRLNKKLASLEAKVSNIQSDLNGVKMMLEDDDEEVIVREHDNIVGFEDFQSKYGLSLPLKIPEEFDIFEENLLKPEFYQDLKTHLITTTNCHQEVKINCTKLFKRFFKKEVLANYTAKRPGKSKKAIFNKTTFYNCLHDAYTHVYYNPRMEDGSVQDPKIPQYDDSILISAIGLVFNNAKDWEGGRLDRLKNKTDEGGEDASPSKKGKTEMNDDDNSNN